LADEHLIAGGLEGFPCCSEFTESGLLGTQRQIG
jgi:hypothetical protein